MNRVQESQENTYNAPRGKRRSTGDDSGAAMKPGWEVKTLGEIAAINYGYTESAFSEPIGPRFLRITDIQNDRVHWDNVPYCKIDDSEVKKFRLAEGDIVFARTGATTGKSFLVESPPDAVFASYLIRLRLHSNCLLSKFVLYFFQTPVYWQTIRDGVAGSAQGGFNAKKLGSLSIPVPPLAEQQRIVAFLDEAFAGIATARANAEKNLQNARALFESHLNAVFTQGSQSAAEGRGEGWVEKRLGELCVVKHGFAFKSEYFSDGGEYVLLTPGNFYESGGYRDRGQKQKYYVGEVPKGFVLQEGDLLVAMTEQAAGLLGSPVIVPESGKFLHNQRLGLVQSKLGANWSNEFFYHVFNTKAVRKAIHKDASGVKVRHTSPSKIGNVAVSYPESPEEQIKLVRQFDAIADEARRLESIYQRKIAALDELKKSLLHEAFSMDNG